MHLDLAARADQNSAVKKGRRMAKVTLIDNYDSFTWNLVHCLGALGAEVQVHRNDKVSVNEIVAASPDAIVLSPGPCRPQDAGICLDLIKAAGSTIPIFGVCLGHQALGEVFGGEVVRAPEPVHGKLATIEHQGETVFHGINSPFQAARYHSLVVRAGSLPDNVQVTATTDGLVMALSHKGQPSHGVQFHPESIASDHGLTIFANFLELAVQWNATRRWTTVLSLVSI